MTTATNDRPVDLVQVFITWSHGWNTIGGPMERDDVWEWIRETRDIQKLMGDYPVLVEVKPYFES